MCAVASVVLFGLALGFDPGAGSELVERLRDAEPGDATLVRWAAVTDMLGYYLFPVALIVAVRERIPWSSTSSRDFATVAGVLYGTIGAIGAGMLASAAPPLIEGAAPGSRVVLQTLADTVEGLWQWLEPVPFTVWAGGGSARVASPPCLLLGIVRSSGRRWRARLGGSDLRARTHPHRRLDRMVDAVPLHPRDRGLVGPIENGAFAHSLI